MIQHSPMHCSRVGDIVDICLSTTQAMLDRPADEQWADFFSYSADRFNGTQIELALDVRYKEGVEQFYSIVEDDITRRDKRHDRRYERVESWNDGSVKSAMGILMKDRPYDWLDRLWTLDKVRDAATARDEWSGGSFEEFFPQMKDCGQWQGQWSSAFRALTFAIKGVVQLDHARRFVKSIRENIEREKENA